MYQISIKSVNSFESYRVYRQTVRQIPSQKPFFLTKGLSKRGDLIKNGGGGGQILHKSNTFSYENVKKGNNWEYYSKSWGDDLNKKILFAGRSSQTDMLEVLNVQMNEIIYWFLC